MTLQQRVNALATTMGTYIKNNILPRLLPSGGTTGQVLTKSASGNYLTKWTDKGDGFGFQQVPSVAVAGETSNFYGRVVQLPDGSIYQYVNDSAGEPRFLQLISSLDADSFSPSNITAASTLQLQQLIGDCASLSNAVNISSALSVLDISTAVPADAGNVIVNAAMLFSAVFLKSWVVLNTGAPKSVTVNNINGGASYTTPLLITGDILIPKISQIGEFSYVVTPAPVVDTDYVSIFNAALV